MSSIFFKYYADVEKASDVAVRKEYGVAKAMVLKVLEKLLVADIAAGKKSAPAAAKKPAAKRGRKSAKAGRKPGRRGRKPGRKPGRKVTKAGRPPAKRGRKPMVSAGIKPAASAKIEIS